MCGIAAVISARMLTADDIQAVNTMATALRHRGPRDSGTVVIDAKGKHARGTRVEDEYGPRDSQVAFAHSHHSILDPTPLAISRWWMRLLAPLFGRWRDLQPPRVRGQLVSEGVAFRFHEPFRGRLDGIDAYRSALPLRERRLLDVEKPKYAPSTETAFGAEDQMSFRPLIERVRENTKHRDFVDIERLVRPAKRRRGARFQELWPPVSVGLCLEYVVGRNWVAER